MPAATSTPVFEPAPFSKWDSDGRFVLPDHPPHPPFARGKKCLQAIVPPLQGGRGVDAA